MSTLKAKAQEILDEKNLKIISTNVKKGVTIFDVTGTYEGDKSTEDGFYLSGNSIVNNSSCPARLDWVKVFEIFWNYSYSTHYTMMWVNNTSPDNDIDMSLYYDTIQLDFYDENDNLIYSGNCFGGASDINKSPYATYDTECLLIGRSYDELYNENNWKSITKCVISDKQN